MSPQLYDLCQSAIHLHDECLEPIFTFCVLPRAAGSLDSLRAQFLACDNSSSTYILVGIDAAGGIEVYMTLMWGHTHDGYPSKHHCREVTRKLYTQMFTSFEKHTRCACRSGRRETYYKLPGAALSRPSEVRFRQGKLGYC